jgi:transketolase
MNDEELQDFCQSIQVLMRTDDDRWEKLYGNKEGLYGFIKSRDQQMKDMYSFDQNHHDALKGIDDYQKYKSSEPNSPERITAWINQLSPWNLERGVETLRERDQQIALAARIEAAEHIQGKLMADEPEVVASNRVEDYDNAWFKAQLVFSNYMDEEIDSYIREQATLKQEQEEK